MRGKKLGHMIVGRLNRTEKRKRKLKKNPKKKEGEHCEREMDTQRRKKNIKSKSRISEANRFDKEKLHILDWN